jgi:5'-nucleotidase
MPIDLSDTLVVAISSTALFDLSEPDKAYKKARESRGDEEAIRQYREIMFKTENDELLDGTGLPVVEALLKLNKHGDNPLSPLVQVVVMSRNSPETGMRVLNNIRRRNLDIPRTVFTGGETVTDYLSAYKVDLFLTTDQMDAETVADSNVCAVALLKEPPSLSAEKIEDQVRIAFDGDAVLFDEESEIVYKNFGLPNFLEHEKANEDIPMASGPYAAFLKKLARLQDRLPFQMELSPIRISIVTARNAPADIRVIKTLRNWGVYADAAFFMGGLEKTDVLKALKPHIFFDDQDVHLDRASTSVASGKVPYRSGSQLAALAKKNPKKREARKTDKKPLWKRFKPTPPPKNSPPHP